ncbi:hypothetical protein GH721_14075 [Kriegella sp. EG-1]|nr:hypothetical protein [Flavobacteriaceae bacterium EG-1]
MKIQSISIAIGLAIAFAGCKDASTKEVNQETLQTKTKISFQNKAHELVYNMIEKVGNYQNLKTKKDVTYYYTYTTPDGSTDKSIEKYIFEGELSYGKYNQHQRTLPQIEGIMEQGFDGKEYWLKANGTVVNDSTALKKVMFNRPTNFYWFTMLQKLNDPGLKYEYLGEKVIDNKNFDIVKVSFELNNNKPTDIYQLYINKKTGIVDQFLFTVAEYGVVDTPLLMQLEYEEVDDFLIPTIRKYKKSNWEAKVTDAPWILVNWSNITFNNDFNKEEFSL